jgi:hypothetical protein
VHPSQHPFRQPHPLLTRPDKRQEQAFRRGQLSTLGNHLNRCRGLPIVDGHADCGRAYPGRQASRAPGALTAYVVPVS